MMFSIVFGLMTFITTLSGGLESDSERFKTIGTDLTKQFVIYSIGPFRALDIGLNNNFIEESGGYMFGRATIVGGGIDYYATGILSRIGINIKSVRERTMSKLQNDYVIIGNDTDFNFAYTNLMYHYYDFGVFGVFIFPLLFGYFVRYVINQIYVKRTFSLLILISFLFIACIQLLQFWFFIGLYQTAFVLFLLFLSNKEFKKKNRYY